MPMAKKNVNARNFVVNSLFFMCFPFFDPYDPTVSCSIIAWRFCIKQGRPAPFILRRMCYNKDYYGQRKRLAFILKTISKRMYPVAAF